MLFLSCPRWYTWDLADSQLFVLPTGTKPPRLCQWPTWHDRQNEETYARKRPPTIHVFTSNTWWLQCEGQTFAVNHLFHNLEIRYSKSVFTGCPWQLLSIALNIMSAVICCWYSKWPHPLWEASLTYLARPGGLNREWM